MQRPEWDEYGLIMAAAAATRGDCSRSQVGAAMMHADHSIYPTGYNGSWAGGPSCLKGECPRGQLSYEEAPANSSYDTGPGVCHALHAEQNVLLRASWADMDGSTLYVTREPCGGCWKMIKGTPLVRVVWPEGEWNR